MNKFQQAYLDEYAETFKGKLPKKEAKKLLNLVNAQILFNSNFN